MSPYQQIRDSSLSRQADWGIQAAVTAMYLYRAAVWRARLLRWWSRLTRHPHSLLNLNQVGTTVIVRDNHVVGVCTVPIRRIRGSECRSEDFDADFCPLQKRTQGRWLSIATARLMGATMPPVELIHVGDIYYVRDGHHRISVARAMGQEYVEAEVMVWEKGEQPLCQRAAIVSMPKLEVSGLGVPGCRGYGAFPSLGR
jgi:hypothetical protein